MTIPPLRIGLVDPTGNIKQSQESVSASQLANIIAGPAIARPMAAGAFAAAFGSDPLFISYTNLEAGSFAFPANSLRAAPYLAGRGGRIDRVAFFLQVNGGAGSVMRVGVYDADQSSGYPTTLLADGGQFATDAGAPAVLSGVVSPQVTLEANHLYWLAALAGVAAPTVTNGGATRSVAVFMRSQATPTPASQGIDIAQAYGALPAIFPAGAFIGDGPGIIPIVAVRYASLL